MAARWCDGAAALLSLASSGRIRAVSPSSSCLREPDSGFDAGPRVARWWCVDTPPESLLVVVETIGALFAIALFALLPWLVAICW